MRNAWMRAEPSSSQRRALVFGLLCAAALASVALLLQQGLWQRIFLWKPLAPVIALTIEREGTDAGVSEYRSLRARGFPGLFESEPATNDLGYAFLRKGDATSAIRILQLNVETHPESANAYDSLGEAFLAAGDRAHAIADYQHALALRPSLKSAVAAMHELTGATRPRLPLILLIHIVLGGIGLLAGMAAIAARKGSRAHARVGQVFVVAMLGMSMLGAIIGLQRNETINVIMGSFTFYLVASGFLVARGPRPSVLDWVTFAMVLTLVIGFAADTLHDSIGIAFMSFFGVVASLAALGDARRLSLNVSQRECFASHLARMCAALFLAATSLFLGQAQIFPGAVRATGVLYLPGGLVVGAMLYWLMRVRRPLSTGR